MSEMLSSLANTPIPTILVIGGILFIFIALGGQLGAQIVTDKIRPTSALIAGVFFMILGIGLYASAVLAARNSGGSQGARPAKPQPEAPIPGTETTVRPRVIFTRSLSDANAPTEDIKQISINTSKIYIYCTWFGITPGTKYKYHSEIFDGAGTRVISNDSEYTSDNDTFNTWTWYLIMNNVDHPGIWTFHASFGDQKTQEQLIVTDK